MPIIAIILTLVTAQCISDSFGWHFIVALIPAFIVVLMSFFLLNGIFNISILCCAELAELIKKIDKKRIIGSILIIVIIAISYNTFFRYKYRTYKYGSSRVQVIKIDKLTGKSTVSFPEFEKEK